MLAESKSLDYELEVGGALVCGENAIGETVLPIARAEERIFGLCLLNDWSARHGCRLGIPAARPVPLPKSFATTVGVWVVPLDALEPFRTTAFARHDGDLGAMPYLNDAADRSRAGSVFTLEVWLRSAAMRAAGLRRCACRRVRSSRCTGQSRNC